MTETLEQRAATRCANEVGKAIFYSRALKGLSNAEGYYSIDFIRLAEWAFFDQMFAHAIKVLDPREKAGLWFLLKGSRDKVEAADQNFTSDITVIEAVVPKLKHIRDKTHFHLDTHGVSRPAEVWAKASITKDLMDAALDAAFRQVGNVHRLVHGRDFSLPDYDGTDATRVAELAYESKILQGQYRKPFI